MPKIDKIDLPLITNQKEMIGKRIARLRKERGLTQEELAEKIGIKRTVIADYERGKIRIYAEMVARIALALSVSTDTLIGIEITKNPGAEISLRVIKRGLKIDKLPEVKQKKIYTTLDALIRDAET